MQAIAPIATTSVVGSGNSAAKFNRNHGLANQHQAQSFPNQHMTVPCLYTKQILKKRKAWSDGKAKISHSKGFYFCTLIDAEDLRCKAVSTTLKLSKFVTPSTVAPPPRKDAFDAFRENNQPANHGRSTGNSRASNGPGKRSLDEELDDLWGDEPPPPKTHSYDDNHRGPARPNYPPQRDQRYLSQRNEASSSLPEYFDTSFSAAIPPPTLNLHRTQQSAAPSSRPTASDLASLRTTSHGSSRGSSKASSPSGKGKVTFAHGDMLSSVYRYAPPSSQEDQEPSDWGASSALPVTLRVPASSRSVAVTSPEDDWLHPIACTAGAGRLGPTGLAAVCSRRGSALHTHARGCERGAKLQQQLCRQLLQLAIQLLFLQYKFIYSFINCIITILY